MTAEYHSIKTQTDIDFFLHSVNGLHDAYLIAAAYTHHGHTCGNPHLIDHTRSKLKLQFLVTSIGDAMVELVFSTLSEWQIRDDMTDILDTAISITAEGKVIWADDQSTAPEICRDGSYVIAENMKWRLIE